MMEPEENFEKARGVGVVDPQPVVARDARSGHDAGVRMNTALGRFRVVAFLEGLSYVLLLGVAMPLKYLADMPLAVRIVGSAHGFLFIVYVATLIHAAVEREWSPTFSFAAFAASLFPGATFYLDRVIREMEEPERDGPSTD